MSADPVVPGPGPARAPIPVPGLLSLAVESAIKCDRYVTQRMEEEMDEVRKKYHAGIPTQPPQLSKCDYCTQQATQRLQFHLPPGPGAPEYTCIQLMNLCKTHEQERFNEYCSLSGVAESFAREGDTMEETYEEVELYKEGIHICDIGHFDGTPKYPALMIEEIRISTEPKTKLELAYGWSSSGTILCPKHLQEWINKRPQATS